MAYQSGSGSEQMRRAYINTQQASATTFKWDGTAPSVGETSHSVPANHIITLISFTVCESTNSAAETIAVWLYDGANNIQIVGETQPLAAGDTFIWNTKLVLIGGDKVTITVSAGDTDVYYTYLDQDWS